MKKTIKILGLFALSTLMFSISNRIQDGKTVNLDSLIVLSTANAEDGGGGSLPVMQLLAAPVVFYMTVLIANR